MLKKIMTIMLSATLLMSSIVPISALDKVDRIKGSNNYETAEKIADNIVSSSIILVNIDKTTADALSAAALAGVNRGVILFTSKEKMSETTEKKINNASNVYIIGNEDAISKKIEEKIKQSGKIVERIGGSDRYETSYKVADKVIDLTGKLEKVFIANGKRGEADIVSASPVSYRDKSPILLTDGKYIKDNIKKIANKAKDRYIIGGDEVVSEKIKYSLNTSERIGGSDRFWTNKKIIDKFYSNPNEFNIVEAHDYAIAVAASSISTERPVVLVDYKFDPLALKEAKKIIAIGNISESAISKAIAYSGGLSKFNYSWTKNKYIAHALGGIDGKNYSNSPQALEYNYKKGFRVFEVDLDISKDDKLIAWHLSNSNKLKEMQIPTKYINEKPTENEFKKLKIYGKYDPMIFKDIIYYMEKYKDIYMVIDLKQATNKKVRKLYEKIVEESSPEVLERIIPQTYNESIYNEIMNVYNFKSMIFTTYTMSKLNEEYITNFCALNGIKVLVIEGRFYTPSLVERCKTKGIKLYMNTYNDQNVVNSYTKKGISGFYTDFLTP